MRDKITRERVANLHPAIRDEVAYLIDKAEEELPVTVAVRVVQGWRTFEEQGNLFAIGRTVMGAKPTPKKPMGLIVTRAKPGLSNHNYGLSFDFCLMYDGDGNGTFEKLSWKVNDHWRVVVKVFENAGYSWGGRWSNLYDAPHLEKSFGFSTRQLLARYKAGKFIPGTKFVNLQP